MELHSLPCIRPGFDGAHSRQTTASTAAEIRNPCQCMRRTAEAAKLAHSLAYLMLRVPAQLRNDGHHALKLSSVAAPKPSIEARAAEAAGTMFASRTGTL